MINFDALTLKLFCHENSDFFKGARIQKIQQPSRLELIFYIRNFGETKKFYINFNPQFYHICFMSNESALRRDITIPKSAPMFCMLLRKYIQNSKIIKVDVPKYERIFEVYFEYFNELNEKSQLCLAIELMGKYSNVILYNYDTNVIIGCAHNVSSEKSRERELCGLLPYVYPVKQKKKNLLKVSIDSFKASIQSDNPAKSVSEKYHYLTVSFVQDVIDLMPEYSLEKLYKTLFNILSGQEYYYSISNDYSKYYYTSYIKGKYKFSNINDMIDEYFSYHQQRLIIFNLKSKIIKNINSRITKLNQLKIKQEQQIQKADKMAAYKETADLIMSNLYYIKQGMRKVNLYDFKGGEIEIDLDENMTPVENANRYYTFYKKTKASYEHACIMAEETKSKLLYLEEMKYYTEKSQNAEELKEIFSEIIEEKEIKNEKNAKIDFVEFNNVKIFIGKNKKQNDYILSKLSSSEDIWFHPLNAPGAHILVKINSSKELTSDIILKAAQLTKEYSSQKNNSKTSIIYTKRKYLRKANNKQAFVTYRNETEIVV